MGCGLKKRRMVTRALSASLPLAGIGTTPQHTSGWTQKRIESAECKRWEELRAPHVGAFPLLPMARPRKKKSCSDLPSPSPPFSLFHKNTHTHTHTRAHRGRVRKSINL
jgi:hypothetical protein